MNDFPWLSHHYLTAEHTLENAQIALIGAPYDSTTSFRPGARFGPSAIRTASYGIESYSPYVHRDLTELRICDLGDLELPFGSPERAFSTLSEGIRFVLNQSVVPILLGGEHSLTYASVRVFQEFYPNLHLIVFDAHCDLREEYLEEPYSHASVVRRCCDLLGTNRIHQFGIRSGMKEEFFYARQHGLQHFYNPQSLLDVLQRIGNEPIYLSIDLDVHDPSVFPGTGTPEPGGVTFLDTLDMFNALENFRIVGADLMELSPHYDSTGCSSVLAAKVLRELLVRIV
ncbi:MAG: agmatinase [bacterium]|nr:agmatinase [bacterium]